MAKREDLVVKELKKRAAAVTVAAHGTFSVEDICFDKQIAFIQDKSRFKTGVCSRRSGKTVSCAVDLLVTASSLQGDVAYITLNRRSAKKIIWRDLLKYNKQFNLGGHPDNTELTLKMPNGSIIHLYGAKDETDADKIRGMSFRKVYIDEAQSFRPYLEEMIEDIIEPALTDYYGQLILIGTPGPIPTGFFYNVSHNDKWAHHHWTMHDNPHIKLKSGQDPATIIAELAERRGLSINSPSIQREFFGQWVKDSDSLVYQFSQDLNIYHELPNDLRYVFGVDIGWKDSDAIAVLGYSASMRKVYLVEEYIRSKNDITSLANQIKALKTKYDPVKIVMDAGALGRKIQEEIRIRHTLHTEAAEKSRKSEFIALFNDDLRTGKFQALKGSRFEEDSYLVQWDYSSPERPTVSHDYHTDIGDAVLYAWRECKHFYEQSVKQPVPTPNQYMLALEEKEAEAMERAKYAKNEEFTDVESWDDLFIGPDYADDF
jgi:Terminase large subunit, T4likevirus-type, N-terminal